MLSTALLYASMLQSSARQQGRVSAALYQCKCYAATQHVTTSASYRDNLKRVLTIQQTRPAADSPLTKLTLAFLRRLARDPSALGPTPEEIKNAAQDTSRQSISGQQRTMPEGHVPQHAWPLKAETLCELWDLCCKHIHMTYMVSSLH